MHYWHDTVRLSSPPARGQRCGEVEGGDQAGRVREALAGDVVGGTVVRRHADDRQAQRDVHAVDHVECLQRYQGWSWYMPMATS